MSFVVTEYAPERGFTIGKQISSEIENGTVLDFGKLLPLVPGLSVKNWLF